MKVTVILKDFSEQFYNGFSDSIPAFLTLPDAEKFEKCRIMAAEKRVTMKIESGKFSDAVELNSLRKLNHSINFKIEPRKGYKLATFEFNRI